QLTASSCPCPGTTGKVLLRCLRNGTANPVTGMHPKNEVVGATGFEPATSCAPCKCATRLRHAPTGRASVTEKADAGRRLCDGTRAATDLCRARLAAQQLQYVLELRPHLADDLLALADVAARLVTGQPLPRSADREAFLVQQTPNLADDQHVLALIVAAVAAPLDGLQLRELLLPVSEHMRLHAAQIADFTDREVALTGDRR